MSRRKFYCAAFTLIELLVVMFLIGITATFSVLAFHVGDHFQASKNTANHLRDVMSLAEEQAMLEPATLALFIDKKGYQVFRYVEEDASGHYHWQPFHQDKDFNFSEFDRQLIVKLSTVDNHPLSKIFFYTDGELTPFILNIQRKGSSKIYRLQGRANGEINQSWVFER